MPQIDKINVYMDRFIVAHTGQTLLAGDMATNKLSEVPWTRTGREKFYFECDKVRRRLPVPLIPVCRWSASHQHHCQLPLLLQRRCVGAALL